MPRPDDFLMNEKNYKNGIPMLTNNPELAANYKGGPVSLIQDESNAEIPERPPTENSQVEPFTLRKQTGPNTYEQYANPNYRPPGPKPTDDMLDLFERRTAYEMKVKEQLPDLNIDVVRVAERDTLAELYRDKSYLLYGRQTKEDESRYQAILNRNLQLAMQKQSHARKLYDGAMNLFDEDVKSKRKVAEEQAKAGYKMPSEDERIYGAFVAKYGRPPSDQEFLDAKSKYKADAAGLKTGVTEGAKVQAQKGILSPETLEQAYEYVKNKGEFAPEIARLFRVPGAQIEVMDYVAKRAKEDNTISPGAKRATTAVVYSGLKSSIQQQEKQMGLMGNFVRNINKQADYAEKLFEHLQRTDVRALNMPIIALRKKFVGSGLESVYEMFIKEMSAEALKLSMGSSQSIAQIPEGNRAEWERVHDLNLPLEQARRVFQGTRDMANTRYASVEEQLNITKQKLSELGQENQAPQPTGGKRDLSTGVQYLKAAKDRQDTIKRIQALSKKGWSREDLQKVVSDAGIE